MTVTFDATSNSGIGEFVNSMSWTHTCSGTNRGLFVGVGSTSDPPSSTSSVTYNGINMVEQWDIISPENLHSSGHTLANPASGANTVTATIAPNSGPMFCGAISMTGVHQLTPVGTPATSSNTNGAATVTVTGVSSDDFVVDAVTVFANTSNKPTVGPDQTERWNLAGLPNTPINGGAGSSQPGTAGGVMSWTVPFLAWVMGAIAFKPAPTFDPATIAGLLAPAHGLHVPRTTVVAY